MKTAEKIIKTVGTAGEGMTKKEVNLSEFCHYIDRPKAKLPTHNIQTSKKNGG